MSKETASTEVAWNGTTDGYYTGALFRYGPAVDDSNKVFKLGEVTRSWLFATDTATYTAISIAVILVLSKICKG